MRSDEMIKQKMRSDEMIKQKQDRTIRPVFPLGILHRINGKTVLPQMKGRFETIFFCIWKLLHPCKCYWDLSCSLATAVC
jgi:hypothetical protein